MSSGTAQLKAFSKLCNSPIKVKLAEGKGGKGAGH